MTTTFNQHVRCDSNLTIVPMKSSQMYATRENLAIPGKIRLDLMAAEHEQKLADHHFSPAHS
jgi:hypothetical protein